MQYAASLEKLETALRMYASHKHASNKYDFSSVIKETRSMAHVALQRFKGSRAYDSPESLIKNIGTHAHEIAGRLQLEGGARLHEVSRIRPDQLKGERIDSYSGRPTGIIGLQGKGGKRYDVFPSIETYAMLKAIIDREGEFLVSKNAYRDELKCAANATGQKYTGSHGLRWSFAQRRFTEVQKVGGLTFEQALLVVSQEMGHSRPDISEHYLRRN